MVQYLYDVQTQLQQLPWLYPCFSLIVTFLIPFHLGAGHC